MTLFTPLRTALLGSAFALPFAAFAQDTPPDRLDLQGHEVTRSENADFEQVISVDGVEVLKDGQVLLDGITEVAGQQVVTGISGAGGNACNSTPFVLSLKDGKPVIDGPIDSCSWFEMTPQDGALIFHSEAFPGSPAEIWTWSPVSGLTEASPEGFTPKSDQGWENFASLDSAHPIDALGFAPVYAEVKAGMSAEDWDAYTGILAQLGSGDLVEGGYRGSACNKLICDTEWAILWIDQASQQAFTMWKGGDDEMPKTWPADPGSWPEWVQLDAASSAGGAN